MSPTPAASAGSEPADLAAQVTAAAAAFGRAYGRAPTHGAAAPGRVNLLGEHTDYNDGYVLPMAIERQSVVVAARRDDGVVRLRSLDTAGEAVFALEPGLGRGEPGWSNYLRGALAGCLGAGLEPGGFDALLSSTVPMGGGLSSSASIEVAAATLAEALAGRSLDPVAKALVCQQAEHEYAGVPCGIMDQFIATLGEAGAALLIDCRDHTTRRVPLDDPAVVVLIINSNVTHELTGGEYARRRRQCEAAAKALGVRALRDAALGDLERAKGGLDAGAYRRARHVITENARALDAAHAMARRDWAQVGELMFAGHASLRDDFEVSTPELDTLVRLAAARREGGGVLGSRMTGGGFGGCTVTLARADRAQAAQSFITSEYQRLTGIEPTAFLTRPAAGARALEIAKP